MADYKQNMGAYQNDYPDGQWKGNIGASQTEPPSFEATDIVISGEGSIEISDLEIHQGTEVTITGQGTLEVLPTHINVFNLGTIIPLPLLPIIPGQDVDQGSADIWGVVLPTIMPPPLSDGTFEQVTPTPADENEHTGAGQINGHELPWYEAAHLLPRVVQDVGNVVTEQTITCELYNADRYAPITVSSVVDSLGAGFAVVDVPATPFDIASQNSLLFTIKVLQQGDLTIDGDLTFTLSTGETYTIYVIGSRIILLPIRPETPLREHLLFNTKIITAIDTSEQRIANRGTPRSTFEFTIKEDRKRIEMILFDRLSKLIAIPAWHEPSFLSSAGAIDDFTVDVNTTNYANFYVGGYAVVFKDKYTFDALEIDSMDATSLTFKSGLNNVYPINTQVMPMMTAYTEATAPAVKAVLNDQTFQVKLHVHATDNDIADDSAWSTYNSKVFLDGPNLVRNKQLQEAFRTKVYVLDNRGGDRTQFAQQLRSLRHSTKGFKTNTRQELWELRQLLHFLKGRQVSFYIPTFSKDLIPNQTLVVSNSTFTMDNIGYTKNARDRWSKKVFRIHLFDGTILTRTIQNSSELSMSVEQLTVDIVWPYNIAPVDIERIEFLEKVRFDSDDIMIIHQNALGVAECTVPIVEVTDDDV